MIAAAGGGRSERRWWAAARRADAARPGGAALVTRFLRDPIGCLIAPARAPRRPCACSSTRSRSARAAAASSSRSAPEYNRSVLSDTERFHATGQTAAGPARLGPASRALRPHAHARRAPRRAARAAAAAVPAAGDPREVRRDGRGRRRRCSTGWAPGRTLDVKREMRRLMLRLSSEVLFGREDPERSWRLGELIGDWLSRNFEGRVWLALFDLPGTPYRGLLRSAARHRARDRRDGRRQARRRRAGRRRRSRR